MAGYIATVCRQARSSTSVRKQAVRRQTRRDTSVRSRSVRDRTQKESSTEPAGTPGHRPQGILERNFKIEKEKAHIRELTCRLRDVCFFYWCTNMYDEPPGIRI